VHQGPSAPVLERTESLITTWSRISPGKLRFSLAFYKISVFFLVGGGISASLGGASLRFSFLFCFGKPCFSLHSRGESASQPPSGFTRGVVMSASTPAWQRQSWSDDEDSSSLAGGLTLVSRDFFLNLSHKKIYRLGLEVSNKIYLLFFCTDGR